MSIHLKLTTNLISKMYNFIHKTHTHTHSFGKEKKIERFQIEYRNDYFAEFEQNRRTFFYFLSLNECFVGCFSIFLFFHFSKFHMTNFDIPQRNNIGFIYIFFFFAQSKLNSFCDVQK